jgi:glycerophosphoryl diester phosphodiesterase
VEPSLPGRGGSHLPALVAHRGYASRFPENTIPALAASIEAGARFVEVDVQLSSDGHPFLFHDRTLERMCDAPGPVHARTRAELARLSCAETSKFGARFADVRIADLAGLVELLRAHPEVFAFVEAKRASIEAFGASRMLDAILPVLEPVASRVALISFSLPFLATARKRTRLPLGAVFDAWSERETKEAKDLAAELVFCDVEGLPASGSLDAGAARLAVYEVADPALALTLAGRGVALIETFAIGEMIAGFRELERRIGGTLASNRTDPDVS